MNDQRQGRDGAGQSRLDWPKLFRAAPLPTAFGLLGLTAGGTSGFLALTALDNLGTCLSLGGIALFCFSVALCSFADGVCRYREFCRFKRVFRRYGFRPRIVSRGAASRCQRDAILFAAAETGHKHHARLFFHALGYRWYHLLPDGIILKPWHFFRPDFIRSTFLPGKNVRCS